MRPTFVAAVAAIACCMPLLAQSAAPTGETAPLPSRSEVEMFLALEAERLGVRLPKLQHAVSPYSVHRLGPAADGRITRADHGGTCVVAWPERQAPDDRPCRALLLHRDGTSLIASIEPGAPPDDAAELALAAGGRGLAQDLLRQPGKSVNGTMWLLFDQVGVSGTVDVVDEHGAPIEGVEACVVPQEFELADAAPTPAPMPIGIAATNAKGTARIRGLRAAATAITLGGSGVWGRPSAMTLAADGRSLRVVASREDLIERRARANESAAIATLKNISSAQAQCQASSAIDANGNGAGEYGFFAELAGAAAVRTDASGAADGKKISPPVLSTAFARVDRATVVRSGYVFQIFLPGKDCQPTAEATAGGGAGVAIDPTQAEVTWCCYAWPVAPTAGRRAFFVNQNGDVLAAPNEGLRYLGKDKPITPGAAFAAGGKGRLDERVAANTAGIDGQTWKVVN